MKRKTSLSVAISLAIVPFSQAVLATTPDALTNEVNIFLHQQNKHLVSSIEDAQDAQDAQDDSSHLSDSHLERSSLDDFLLENRQLDLNDLSGILAKPDTDLTKSINDLLVSIDGKKVDPKKVDKIDMGVTVGKLVVDKSDADKKKNTVSIVPLLTTTRSADALLGALTSPQFIADDEMQNVRSRRGELRNGSGDNGGAWGRFLNNSTHVRAAGTAGYRLQQNGLELGGDKIFDVGDDRLALGMFGTYSHNTLKQDRGDSSNVASWGTGVYATWFGVQGYYVDGTLKYNHFNTRINAKTETGRAVNGSYDQNGLGATLETGYRFNLPHQFFVEPYVRATYFVADASEVTLSNGLEAKANRLQSMRGEAGVTAGKRLDFKNGMTVSPYATASAEQEFAKNNKVRMNDAVTFNNDLSGTTGKYGLGVSAQVTKNASVFAEADYRKGEHVESPLMANAGFRVSF